MSAPAWSVHLPAGMAPDDVDLHAEATLPRAWASRFSDRRAIHDGDRGWLSGDELGERSARVAGRLHRAGLQTGDRVVMSAAASADLVVTHVAALRMGLVVVPVNGAYTEREVAHIAGDCGPAGAIVDEPARGEWVSSAAGRPVITVDPAADLPDGPPPALDAVAPGDLGLICYTSGTTGAPKGAMLTHANLLAGAASVALAWRWKADDRLVLCLPLFHMHGLGVGLHGTLLAGASAVLLPRFDVDGVLDTISEHRATLFFGVPTMYERLSRSERLGELGALRLCVSGSAPLPADLHAPIAAGSGQHVLERYGMTETLMNVSNPYDGERRAGTVGFPLPGVEMRLDGPDGREGEVLLRGPNVFPGYWQRDEATQAAFTDGWFKTGDLGSLDDDGYLRLEGRATELIITGGYNVYPREVEDVLREHPAVADAAVVGRPSPEWGEVVTAYVVPDGPLDLDELMAFAAGRLAPFKRPRAVRLVTDLPRNALGKVMKHALPT